jgi:hypothetical protein
MAYAGPDAGTVSGATEIAPVAAKTHSEAIALSVDPPAGAPSLPPAPWQ